MMEGGSNVEAITVQSFIFFLTVLDQNACPAEVQLCPLRSYCASALHSLGS